MIAPATQTAQRHGGDTKTAVVVGAGPAGVAAAVCLARRGWRCEVFERREEPVATDTARGYPILLNARSFRTLRLAGLEIDSLSASAHPRTGWFMNGKEGATFPMDKVMDKRQYMVDRALFNKEMYMAAAAVRDWGTQGGSIRWHWGQNLSNVNFQGRVAVFTPSASPSGPSTQGSTSSISAEYDLLIGADGCNSAVRKELLAAVPSIKAESVVEPLFTYKTFHELPISPAIEAEMPGITSHRPGQCVYMFSLEGIPKFNMFKQRDRSISGIMTNTDTYQDLGARLSKQFNAKHPGLAQWLPAVIDATSEAKQPPANPGCILKLSQFHGPSCVLLGDSAHPVTSNLAQGYNMALESVRVFINTLDSVGLEAAPAAFTKARLQDAHAFQTLEFSQVMAAAKQPTIIKGQNRMPSPVEKGLALLLLQLSWAPALALHRLLPSFFSQPALLSGILRNQQIPFSKALATLRLQAGLVAASAIAGLMIAASLATKLAATVLTKVAMA